MKQAMIQQKNSILMGILWSLVEGMISVERFLVMMEMGRSTSAITLQFNEMYSRIVLNKPYAGNGKGAKFG